MTPNDLYPDPPRLIRSRVPTGPHELSLTWPTVGTVPHLGCPCTEHFVKCSLGTDVATMWRRWLDEVEHDPKLPPPAITPANRAQYLHGATT